MGILASRTSKTRSTLLRFSFNCFSALAICPGYHCISCLFTEFKKELKQLLSEEEGILSQVLEKTTQTELKEIDTKILKLEKIAEEVGLTKLLMLANIQKHIFKPSILWIKRLASSNSLKIN